MEQPDAAGVTFGHWSPKATTRAPSADLQPGTRILVRLKRTGFHTDIDYKLQRLKYQRIVIWQVDKGRIFFVVTPEYEI